ncbi:hypothetical protein [Phaeobacter sp. C3_T13_0]|uniref:hypothetical protein n=1 Tax=Phaeobacter cretensis TaxID=3342641 RepID=UPI0039BC7DBA
MQNANITAHLSAIGARMREKGLYPYIETDHSALSPLFEQVGKEKVHPMSSVSEKELGDGKAFWLFLQKEGRSIACISAKLIELGRGDFGSYMSGLASSRYERASKVVSNVAQPLIDEMSGRMIYFGGIEFAADQKGSVRLLGDFAQYAKLTSALRWEFDWMYTIIAYRHRRLADDYGFHWRLRNAIHWSDPVPEGLANDHMVLATNPAHFFHVLGSVKPGEL